MKSIRNFVLLLSAFTVISCAQVVKYEKSVSQNISTQAEERKQLAVYFYQKYNPEMQLQDIEPYLLGIDFYQPVDTITVEQGTILYQFAKYNTQGKLLQGQYYTDDPKYTPSELGISENYNLRDPDNGWKHSTQVGTVHQEKIIVEKKVKGLKSFCAPIQDTWSLQGQTIPAKGGGSQVYIPKSQLKD